MSSMKMITVVVMAMLVSTSVFASRSCKRYLKWGESSREAAEKLVEQADELFVKHDEELVTGSTDRAKRILDNAIKRAELALKKYDHSANSFIKAIEKCDRESRIEKAQDNLKEMKVQRTDLEGMLKIFKEIEYRL
jgi:predicted RecB family endonuclease